MRTYVIDISTLVQMRVAALRLASELGKLIETYQLGRDMDDRKEQYLYGCVKGACRALVHSGKPIFRALVEEDPRG